MSAPPPGIAHRGPVSRTVNREQHTHLLGRGVSSERIHKESA